LPYFFIQNLVDLLVVTRGADLVSLELQKHLKFLIDTYCSWKDAVSL